MKESKLSKILISIATLAICTTGLIAFSKLYLGHIHMHPPTDHDISKMREEIKKEMNKHGNDEAKERAKNDDIPFLRKPKKK